MFDPQDTAAAVSSDKRNIHRRERTAGRYVKEKGCQVRPLPAPSASYQTNRRYFPTCRKMFRIDPATLTRIYDFLTANEMLFRDEPKISKPKKEDADPPKVEPKAPVASETPTMT